MPEPEDSSPRRAHFGFKANPLDKLFISHGGLSSLCFDRNAFFDEAFDIDGFLSSHTQRGIPLEVLKDDLATYRKIVQSALVQLVDREYADFVHLSSSLVGVDRGIEKLKNPVEHHLNQVEKCLSIITGHIHALDAKILRKAKIAAQKQQLKSLISAMECMETLVAVDRKLQEERSTPGRLPLLYRLSDLLLRIYSEEQEISHTAWYSSMRQQLSFIDASFTKILGQELLAVCSGETKTIQSICLVYQHLDRIQVAYQVIADGAVKPALSSVIRNNQQKKSSLEDLLSDIFAVVEERFYCLAYVAQADFILESVWSSLVNLLTTEIQAYLAPDQADLFRRNYNAAKIFMCNLAQLFTGVRKDFSLKFWKHPATCSFLDKWSFPVYYQVRFMEIGTPVEIFMEEEMKEAVDVGSFRKAVDVGDSTGLKLQVSKVTWEAILRCWHPDVCLPELLHRFWKLSLLLIARFRSWLDRLKPEKGLLVFLPEILEDITIFSKLIIRLPSEHVRPVLEGNERDSIAVLKVLSESLEESVEGLEKLEDRFVLQLAAHTALEISSIIKTVQDTPRLYRRTNREVSSSASPYIDNAFTQLVKKLKQEAKLSPEQLKVGYAAALKEILTQFSSLALDLLDSVRRMEDSLKKLRKTRFAAEASAGLTDDDKIRLQLSLDLQRMLNWIDQLGFSIFDFPDFALAKERILSEKPDQGN